MTKDLIAVMNPDNYLGSISGFGCPVGGKTTLVFVTNTKLLEETTEELSRRFCREHHNHGKSKSELTIMLVKCALRMALLMAAKKYPALGAPPSPRPAPSPSNQEKPMLKAIVGDPTSKNYEVVSITGGFFLGMKESGVAMFNFDFRHPTMMALDSGIGVWLIPLDDYEGEKVEQDTNHKFIASLPGKEAVVELDSRMAEWFEKQGRKMPAKYLRATGPKNDDDDDDGGGGGGELVKA